MLRMYLSKFMPSPLHPTGEDATSVLVVPLRDMERRSWSPALLRNRDDPDREAHKIVAIAEAGTGHASDPRFLEERESILAWAQLTPVVDRRVVADIDLA